ncbi:hypothetical protein BFAG_03110 [Bacteroides fragilis 3_1_12]|uniref:YhcG PDDEXK nuclease domain-containing protein n=1 Tax=Bacteroides fragilis 3_1_12 TaxID=457424 RepID=A0ABN0BNM9_BACFG|nr:hypothetical protein BFAG_03110 [Bacteroides fragilis 3_1_12]
MLSHYWKLGHFIRYYQKKLGWGGKIISQISKAIKMNYSEKKGYSPRNLTYMCQFSRTYPLEVLQKLLSCDMELLKDPYIFDIANAKESADERDIEKQLVEHITKYLLEMGNGFAFVARQKHFQVGGSDSYADLILYNIKLHAYIVVEVLCCVQHKISYVA